ncbi:hypothetical protein MSBRW_0480 [Methanosarcina barkeri str. Wiesmoor]|uniref:Uncharacterized protein n=2 Tax=Methanosarcina barkeri TaxID=2208 RepID=A0A0E3QGM8_METBA|nr:hypothetical protein [Methanosarcina barkeri]AKB49733.1 hypothetical protein MSBRW_0480 [Methanosarcina barkeri str. Wiesmoor]
MRRGILWFSGIFLLVVIYLSAPALAHVPVFGGGGKSPETAIRIEDPSKSRVLYGEIASRDLRYYSFNVEKGERIVLGLTIPVEDGNKGFTPNLILIGPGLADKGKVPEKLEVTEGYGAKVLSYSLPESPVYEGFTPSAFYSLVKLDIKAPESGTYYVAVGAIQEAGSRRGEDTIDEKGLQEREISREGNYGLILGYKETFTLKEWISIPLSQIKIYRWEGQGLFLIFTPLVLTLAAGLLAIFLKRETVAGLSPAHISGILAGLFFLGTGMSYIFQMLISLSKSSFSSEVFITLTLIVVSLGLGVVAISLSLKDESYGTGSTRKRIYFSGLGIAGLLFWAGWFIGPILAFEAALLPWKRKRKV